MAHLGMLNGDFIVQEGELHDEQACSQGVRAAWLGQEA
jgi:hypothetical protein